MGSDKKAAEGEVVEQAQETEDVQATEGQAEEAEETTDSPSQETAGSDKKAAEGEVVEQAQETEDVQATEGQAEETEETTDSQSGEEDLTNIQRILDIELPLTVTFGATRRSLRDVLHLAPGSRFELNNRANEPVIVTVNNKIFARGEVVVVDGHYGIRIQEIETAAERIASLGD